MARAEWESQKLRGSPRYGGFDLSQEGLVSLPTTPVALFQLGRTYNEAAVAVCDAALASAGGRDSPAAADERIVPSMAIEAQARGGLGFCLHDLPGELQRGLKLLRQAVTLMRQVARAANARDALTAKRSLAVWLGNLASILNAHCSDGVAHSSESRKPRHACARRSSCARLRTTCTWSSAC